VVEVISSTLAQEDQQTGDMGECFAYFLEAQISADLMV